MRPVPYWVIDGLAPHRAAWREAATAWETRRLADYLASPTHNRLRASLTADNARSSVPTLGGYFRSSETVLEALADLSDDDPDGTYIARVGGGNVMTGTPWQLMIGLDSDVLDADAWSSGGQIHRVADLNRGDYDPIIYREQ